MRKLAVLPILLLLALPAWAERHAIEGRDFDTENTTAVKELHADTGAGFTGDVHWDAELNWDGGLSGFPSSCVYAHDFYPVNGVPGYKVGYVLETEETVVGKQLCLEAIGCAQGNGDDFAGCTDAGTHATLIFTLAQSGAAFQRSFITALSTQDTIQHAGGGHAMCTLNAGGDCANTSVRYKVRINTGLAGCTNPSANGTKWRIRWMYTVTTP